MDRFDMEDVVAPQQQAVDETPVKIWRLKYQAGTIQKNDITDFFQKESRKYFDFQYITETDPKTKRLKVAFKEEGAKEGIINELIAFILGDNPQSLVDKLSHEGNTGAVCGKVFKTAEPTYSCRECGMDATCVLCINCFKKSAHRFHKYKMSTSSGGGCCDCGDEEAWKKDHYCEDHLRNKQSVPINTVISEAIKERCEIVFRAILSFCVNYLEIETNPNLDCMQTEAGDAEEHYCTVLYNDESHTFEQVVNTLTKIVKCGDKEANELVSSIDREGRAVVKCDTFYECSQLKEAIEKQSVTCAVTPPTSRATQSLRVFVLNIRAVACQQFAIQLLTWFQEFLARHCVFRQIFAKVITEKDVPYRIRHILEHDVKLWKTARTAWHRLLISGMLMEYDNKMLLAQEFSNCYATIIQDFIRDDHEHSFSVVSLSVQLFTVPSIAHFLIAKQDILYKLLHTFYHESIEQYIQNNTLHFAKNMAGLNFFKRASHILYDVRYVLNFKPYVWSDELRAGFIAGCKPLLRLLNVMQGMEAVVRQTGQHMDYEPEWECAFNLHIKLSIPITLVLEWAATDKEVLIKLYQMVMRSVVSNSFILGQTKVEERTVAGHVAKCLIYDVASKPVSIHLPLSRLLAGIFLHLGTHELTYDNVVTQTKRTPEELMEPILCTQVMISQVHAGMWRRNGYSLLHQLYFYRNVRCRSEMLDRDIVGLQIGASLIESNQFLIHVLNKFALIDWIQPEYEKSLCAVPTDDDFIRQLSMIDEFLELLIVIIGERYVPGVAHVTEEDRTKKEIIQLLCIKSFSHSELNRALPDSNNDTALEDVIESVAIFKKPQKSDAKSVYVLKDELYDHYNLYFYHYTKEEKSKSEEVMRLRRKNNNDLVCCPPPQLPKLMDAFIPLANLLQCDVMLYILNTVLQRGLDLKAKTFQENHLQKVIHLIGYGLQEELSGNYPFLSFYERSLKYNMMQKLEELSRSQRVETHRDFILWTIRKFKELQAKHVKSKDAAMEDTTTAGSQLAAVETAPPLTAAEQELKEKKERARMAAERRATIMAQMQNAQKNFMKTNAEMFATSSAVAEANDGGSMDWTADEEGAVAYDSAACMGVGRRLQHVEDQNYKCILCYENCTVSKGGDTMVYATFLQKSKVLLQGKDTHEIHTSSCGHVMHVDCWQDYYKNEEFKEQRRPHRNRTPFFPLSQNTDFQCPYCRCLSNTVMPLTPHMTKFSTPIVIHVGDAIFPIDLWIEVLKLFGTELNKLRTDEDPDMWFYGMPSVDTIIETAHLSVELFDKISEPVEKFKLPTSYVNTVQGLIKAVRQYTPTSFSANEEKGLLSLWNSCIYTIQSLEVYLRAVNKPFKDDMSIRHESVLSGLIRASGVYAACLSQMDIKNLLEPMANLLDKTFKQKGSCVLEWDCFSMMANMIFMVPNMLYASTPEKNVVANGSMQDFYALQLYFLANMVKAILQYEHSNLEEQPADCMDYDEDFEIPEELSAKLQQNIATFYGKYNFAARRQSQQQQQEQQTQDQQTVMSEDNVQTEAPTSTQYNSRGIAALFEHIKMESREFLRCSCMFFRFLTDVDFPTEFNNVGGDTFENMCKYLGLSTDLSSYFDNESPYATIMETFASHNDINYYNLQANKKANGEDLQIVPCTRSVPQLVELPEDFSDLINSVSDYICPTNRREEMKTPTMCLICGKILCGQSYCCQPELDTRKVGACTYHANSCGAEIGVYLRVRDCQVVYLGLNKGCFMQPPYLDQYGETDQGLRRGNPLRLCKERYEKIHLSWLSHSLHEEIARLNDNSSVSVIQWNHM